MCMITNLCVIYWDTRWLRVYVAVPSHSTFWYRLQTTPSRVIWALTILPAYFSGRENYHGILFSRSSMKCIGSAQTAVRKKRLQSLKTCLIVKYYIIYIFECVMFLQILTFKNIYWTPLHCICPRSITEWPWVVFNSCCLTRYQCIAILWYCSPYFIKMFVCFFFFLKRVHCLRPKGQHLYNTVQVLSREPDGFTFAH